jgi:hypothetical protein
METKREDELRLADHERTLEQMVRMERDLSARIEREEAAMENPDGVVLKRLSFLLRRLRVRIRETRARAGKAPTAG